MTQPEAFPDPGDQTPAPQPLIGRQRRLIGALQVGVAAAGTLAAVGVTAPDPAGRVASQAFLVVVIAVPLLRVAWLSIRWVNRRDLRFAAVGLAVLAVAAMAAITAW